MNANESENQKIPKKRGRKPKGGKILLVNPCEDKPFDSIPNVILHLKCGSEDIKKKSFISKCITENVESYQFHDNEVGFNINTEVYNSENQEDSSVNQKLITLANDLHNNNISDKRSACFWCTCEFNNHPIYIPKYCINDSYHVYGCFCSPECATGYLFKQSDIDSTSKFERYALLNHIYCKIYDYEKNIKPAPDPHYTLDKFYGNLTIQEYRQLLKNERLLLIVDKPLTRSLPELHIDNDDFVINNKNTGGKFKLKTRYNKQTKSDILLNNFNMK
jgi:hypothetical protein